MIVALLDCETTGLNPETDRVIEIGVVLFDLEEKRLLRCFSTLTQDDTIKVSDEMVAIHKISQKTLDERGVPHKGVLGFITDNFIKQAQYLCAHNAPFDKSFLEAELKRHGLDVWEKPWIDTKTDLPFPQEISSRSLKYLAADHGFLNPFPHAAISDVLTMLSIFTKYNHKLTAENSKSPHVDLFHESSFEDKALQARLKEVGFHWDRPKKLWKKTIRSLQLEEELKKLTAKGLHPKQNL